MTENGVMKKARRSFGEPYPCQKAWPEDCFVQCGGNGIVFSGGKKHMEKTLGVDGGGVKSMLDGLAEGLADKDTYTTAFFEAFPRSPDTFIRGEGKTVEEAEAEAWASFEKFKGCDRHDFERRRYTNGAGFCKHCGMFASKVFPEQPSKTCQEASPQSKSMFVACGKPATRRILSERGRTTYSMCAGCADHNVRNRGCEDVGSVEEAEKVYQDSLSEESV